MTPDETARAERFLQYQWSRMLVKMNLSGKYKVRVTAPRLRTPPVPTEASGPASAPKGPPPWCRPAR